MSVVVGFADEMAEVQRLIKNPPLDFRRIHHPWACAWSKIDDDGLYVIISESVEADEKRWLHVSCSRRTRLPSWADLRRVKDAFCGKERKAIQVFAPASEWVNIHSFALHLWCCLDGDVLPDFRKDGQI